MKRIFALICLLSLSGCESWEEAKARNEQKLPAGCKIIDLDYGDLRAAVICDGRPSSTSVRSWTEDQITTVCDDKGACTQQHNYTHHRHISALIWQAE